MFQWFAMNAFPLQAIFPCGKFSDSFCFKHLNIKGSIAHTFLIFTHIDNQGQTIFYLFALREIFALIELMFGHLRCLAEDMSP